MAAFQKAIDAIDRTTSLIFTDSSQPIQITVGDLSGVSISVGGTWTGAIAFEGSVSGTSWSPIKVYLLSDNSESATITATGHYGINPAPFSQIRIVPTVASGSALVELLAVKTSSFNWLSAIWKLISDRIPALSNGKIPVEVGSVNVSVNNASLEIANDAGNPIPVSDAGGSITVDGLVSISNFPATQVVNTGLTQPLTDAQLRSTPVSVTGTFWQTTQPISASSLPLPTGAATAANQLTANTSLASIDTKIPALGQALASASIPVTLSSDGAFSLASAGASNGTSPWFTKSNTYFQSYIITKNAEAVTYAAGDVYGTRFELTNFGVTNGSFFLIGVNLVSSLSVLPSGMGLFSLFLFDSIPTEILDNGAFTLASSSITPQGIPLNSLSLITNATNSTSQTSQINELFRRGSSTLYGYLVTQSAFTPTNSAANTITITLKAIEA